MVLFLSSFLTFCSCHSPIKIIPSELQQAFLFRPCFDQGWVKKFDSFSLIVEISDLPKDLGCKTQPPWASEEVKAGRVARERRTGIGRTFAWMQHSDCCFVCKLEEKYIKNYSSLLTPRISSKLYKVSVWYYQFENSQLKKIHLFWKRGTRSNWICQSLINWQPLFCQQRKTFLIFFFFFNKVAGRGKGWGDSADRNSFNNMLGASIKTANNQQLCRMPLCPQPVWVGDPGDHSKPSKLPQRRQTWWWCLPLFQLFLLCLGKCGHKSSPGSCSCWGFLWMRPRRGRRGLALHQPLGNTFHSLAAI